MIHFIPLKPKRETSAEIIAIKNPKNIKTGKNPEIPEKAVIRKSRA